ncbi:MAG: thioredoxin domain-containing protein [Brevundimonas sp.]|nr:thioredoxin domain-containing protein [Brevundimonas sp.]
MARFSPILMTALAAIAAPAMALAQTVEPVRAGDRTLGSDTAPVTLTVYLSTTCSHCADWHNNDFPGFKARWVDTGEVRVAFRDLPTEPPQVAIAGAVVARCAPEEKFDDVLDALFRGQARLYAQPGPPAQQTVIGWLAAAGAAGGLTREQMNACFSNEASFTEVEARADQAFADGVNSTPSFFLNGQRTPDSMPALDVAAFEPLIQPLLDGR